MLLQTTSTINEVKCTIQPWSHNWPIDSSDVLHNAGKICASHASSGNPCKGKSTTCEDFMVLWSGSVTINGFLEGCLMACGTWTERKCSVLPVLAMA
jgi:hypothetical protein